MAEYGDYNGLLNRVTQGDCLEVMKLIPDKSIALHATKPSIIVKI